MRLLARKHWRISQSIDQRSIRSIGCFPVAHTFLEFSLRTRFSKLIEGTYPSFVLERYNTDGEHHRYVRMLDHLSLTKYTGYSS